MNFEQLARWIDGELPAPETATVNFTGVSTDSRSITPGQLFFAIRGERHDGHRYLDQAFGRGAAGAVVDREYVTSRTTAVSQPMVAVENTHAAMISLAAQYLDTFNLLRLGITGSNGKTTTKEFTFRLLSAVTSDVYRTPGNFNNLFGLPLAIFMMPEETKTAVMEMGISTPGEMARLAALVRPHLLVVTNVGPTHLEFLGSVENVAREKLSAMKQAQPEAPLVINADDPVLVKVCADLGLKPVTFAVKNDADFRPDRVEKQADGSVVIEVQRRRFRLSLFGNYQISNLIAAYATVRTAGFDFDRVETEKINLPVAAMRGELIKRGDITIISDCYNANPESVKAGLQTVSGFKRAGRLILILGDMLELGEQAVEYHREAGRAVAQMDADLLIGVGPLSRHTVDGAEKAGMAIDRLEHFESAAEVASVINELLEPGDTVFLKGSRGIALEHLLDAIGVGEGID